MQIRTTRESDIDEVMGIYATARAFMAANGNAGQWGTNHPARELIEADVAEGLSHVGVDESDRPHFVFALFESEEPTYQHIFDGAWLNDEPYLTLHRVASDGVAHGVVTACVDFARARAAELGLANLRIDTHERNLPMRRALARAGFAQTGTIHLANGNPRLAFQLTWAA